MGLYRVTRTQAQIILGCGDDVTFEISDCRVRENSVIFPVCPTCKRAYGMVRCIDREADPGSLERDTAIHTLHKRVHALGLYAQDAKPEGVLESMHTLAKNDEVVEALSARRGQ